MFQKPLIASLAPSYEYSYNFSLGACAHYLRCEAKEARRRGRIQGRGLDSDPRFTFHALRFTVLGSGPSTTQMVAGRVPQ